MDIIREGDRVSISMNPTPHIVRTITGRAADVVTLSARDNGTTVMLSDLVLCDSNGEVDQRLILARKIEALATDIAHNAEYIAETVDDKYDATRALYIKHDAAELTQLAIELDDLAMGEHGLGVV